MRGYRYTSWSLSWLPSTAHGRYVPTARLPGMCGSAPCWAWAVRAVPLKTPDGSTHAMPHTTATRIYPLQLSVPAGTLPSAPQVTPWVTEDNVIVTIELEIPPGHNGLTGIRIMKGDSQLLPFGPNSWIIANDYSRVFPIDDYIPTGDIRVQAYNQGSYPHAFFLRMTMTLYTPLIAGSSPVEASALSLPTGSGVADPLSPDAILGTDTTAALANGLVTADQLLPVSVPADLSGTSTVTG